MKSIIESIKKNKLRADVLKKDATQHILINGDCGEIIKYIPAGSVDLIITDPPYNKGLDYGDRFNDRRKPNEYYAWLKKVLIDIPRILKPTGTFYLISYPEINARILPFLEDELKLKFRRWITWHYPSNIGHSYKNFTRSQRSILFFTKTMDHVFNKKVIEQPYKNPTAPVIKERYRKGFTGRGSYDVLKPSDLIELKFLDDVLEVHLLKNNSPERLRNLNSKFRKMTPEERKKYDHPCQLPLGLLELLISVSSNKGDIVLDPFAGTFTTSAAAKELGRNSIGIDLNGRFVKFGIKRIKNN